MKEIKMGQLLGHDLVLKVPDDVYVDNSILDDFIAAQKRNAVENYKEELLLNEMDKRAEKKFRVNRLAEFLFK